MSAGTKLKLVDGEEGNKPEADSAPLIAASTKLEQALKTFQLINQNAHSIAFNAAIEGARMKSKLATFSIVAKQITAQASKNIELSEKLESLIEQITLLWKDQHL